MLQPAWPTIKPTPARVNRLANPSPARILIVNWRCPMNPRRGGAEVHLHEIARRLVKRGHPVTVLTSRPPASPSFVTLDGVAYRRVGSERSFLWRHRPALRALDASGRFDLVIDDISKLPLAVHRVVSAPTIGWCHHVHGRSLYRQLPWPVARAMDGWERRLPAWYAHTPVLAVSPSTRRELIGLGLKPSRVGFIPNAVDAESIQADAPPPPPPEATEGQRFLKADHPLLVYLGRLQPYKNVDCVLRAFAGIQARRPDTELAIIGTGPDLPRLRRLADRLGLGERVTFHGSVSQQRKHHLLHRAWLSVASSSKEGFGICVLEANAAGTPVIASDVPGHRDAICPGRTGLLYPFDDDAALAQAVLGCINHPHRRVRLSMAARVWAQRFRWGDSVQQLLKWTAHFYPHLRPRLALAEPEFEPDRPAEASTARTTSYRHAPLALAVR